MTHVVVSIKWLNHRAFLTHRCKKYELNASHFWWAVERENFVHAWYRRIFWEMNNKLSGRNERRKCDQLRSFASLRLITRMPVLFFKFNTFCFHNFVYQPARQKCRPIFSIHSKPHGIHSKIAEIFFWRMEEKLREALPRVWQLFCCDVVLFAIVLFFCQLFASFIVVFLQCQCEYDFALKTTYAAEWLLT